MIRLLLAAISLSSMVHAGEVVTIESGTPVYNVGPVIGLAASGLSPLGQLGKIQAWLKEVHDSIDAHGPNPAAEVFLAVLNRQIKRIESSTHSPKP